MSALLPAAALAAAGFVWAASGSTSLFVPLSLICAGAVTCTAFRSDAARVAVFVLAGSCGFLLGEAAFQAGSAPGSSVPLPRAGRVVVEGRVERAAPRGNELAATIAVRSVSSEWVDAMVPAPEERGGIAPGPRSLGRVHLVAAADRVPERGELIRAQVSPAERWIDEGGDVWMRASRFERLGAFDRRVDASTALARGRIRASARRVAGSGAPLLVALLLGETDDLDPRTDLLFRRAGAIHLLALSGMHLGVIALLVRAVVRPFAGRGVATVAAIACAVGYLALVGARPGLVRATLLVTATAVAGALDRRRPLVELLAVCFLVQLLVQPSAVDQLGFRLSYLSLTGIALVAGPVFERVRGWVPPVVAGPAAAGFGAQVLTTPVLLASFGRWYPVGTLATVVMAPLVLLLMGGGLVAVLLDLAGVPVSLVAEPLLGSVQGVLEHAAWAFSAVPGVAPLRQGPAVAIASVVAAAAACVGLVALHGRRGDAV